MNYLAKAHWHRFRYRLGEMIGLDRAHKQVHLDPARDVCIILIEAADRILNGLPERVSQATQHLLIPMGVEIRTNATVTQVTAEGLQLADGSLILSELGVWAAGVKAPEVLRTLDGIEANRIISSSSHPPCKSRVIRMCSPSAIAPPARVPTQPRPGRAPAGRPHGRKIERRLHNQPLRAYRYRDFGSLVSLGTSGTVGNLMGFMLGRGSFIEGLFARVMYRSLHIMHDRAVSSTPRAAFAFPTRAMAHRAGPRVRLY